MTTSVAHFHDTVQRLARCLGVEALPDPPELKPNDYIRITHCSDRNLSLSGRWKVETVLNGVITLYNTDTALSHKLFGDRWELVPHDAAAVVS